MKRYLLLLLVLPVLAIACSDDDRDEPYPSIITEMALLRSDANGTISRFTTDGGSTYTLSQSLTGARANAAWRFLLGYALNDNQRATLYQMEPVVVLRDSTKRATGYHDPVAFVSSWPGGGFLNFHLLPRTQGGTHGWGFLRDSTSVNALGGTTHHLSLYHRQGNDPTAYSADTYLSLALDSVATSSAESDSVSIAVVTFDGRRLCRFPMARK